MVRMLDGKTWELCNKYNLDINNITTMTKPKFKGVVKVKINCFLSDTIDRESKEKTKLRFCKNFEQKTYIKQLIICKPIVYLLNILSVKINFTSVHPN